jgi:hypothetical protein
LRQALSQGAGALQISVSYACREKNPAGNVGTNRERREFEHKGAYELLEITAQIEAAKQRYVE